MRTIDDGKRISQELVSVTGWKILDHTGVARAAAYMMPLPNQEPLLAAEALRADARRTLWTAVAVASVLAALLSLLLARPLVGQLGRLSGAATQVRGGDLAARIVVSSEDEIGRLERTFNDMSSSIERAETQKRNLMHDVAHKLRTPLTNIVGMLEAIEDGLRSADEATLATLRAEAALLTALVGELQDLNLAESGQLTFDLASIDIVAECRAAIDAMRDATTGVELSGPEGKPVFAMADARRLRQAAQRAEERPHSYARRRDCAGRGAEARKRGRCSCARHGARYSC